MVSKAPAVVGKSGEKAAANLPRDHGSRLRMFLEGLDAPVDFFEERDTETGALKVVVSGGFVQFVLGQPMDRYPARHFSLARASRRTSRAGRPPRPS